MICSSEKRLFLISISCETELRSDRGHPKGQGQKAKYGGMFVCEAKRLKQLEDENAKLKKLLAERDLEIEVMKEINRKKW